MKEILIKHLSWIIATCGTITGAVLAALFVIRYKIPALCKEVDKLKEQNELHSQFVKKNEVYESDGQPCDRRSVAACEFVGGQICHAGRLNNPQGAESGVFDAVAVYPGRYRL